MQIFPISAVSRTEGFTPLVAARPVAMPYAAESIVVTAAREAKKIWPFLTGMGIVGFAVVKVTAAATPEVRRPSSRLPAGLRAWLAMLLCATAARWLWARSAEFRFWRACASASPAEAHRVLRCLQDIKKSKFTNPNQH